MAALCVMVSFACAGARDVTTEASLSLPPVGVDEPAFDEGRYTSLWFDDFTSYETVNGSGVSMTGGTGANRWAYNQGTGNPMAVTKSGGVSGAGYITAHYDQNNQNAELRPVAPPDGNASYQQLIMSTWLRNRGDFYVGKMLIRKSGGTDGVRFVFVWANAIPYPLETLRAAYWSIDWPYDPLDAANTPEVGQRNKHLTINRDGATANFPGGSQHWYAPNRGRAELGGPTGSDQDNWNDQNWHRFTVRITKESGPTAGDKSDGRLEAWWDGVKVMEWIGDDPSRPEYGAVPMPGQAERIFDNIYFSGPSASESLWPAGNVADVDYGPTRFYTPK